MAGVASEMDLGADAEMDLGADGTDVSPDQGTPPLPSKRKRGRPKGSKNNPSAPKPKDPPPPSAPKPKNPPPPPSGLKRGRGRPRKSEAEARPQASQAQNPRQTIHNTRTIRSTEVPSTLIPEEATQAPPAAATPPTVASPPQPPPPPRDDWPPPQPDGPPQPPPGPIPPEPAGEEPWISWAPKRFAPSVSSSIQDTHVLREENQQSLVYGCSWPAYIVHRFYRPQVKKPKARRKPATVINTRVPTEIRAKNPVQESHGLMGHEDLNGLFDTLLSEQDGHNMERQNGGVDQSMQGLGGQTQPDIPGLGGQANITQTTGFFQSMNQDMQGIPDQFGAGMGGPTARVNSNTQVMGAQGNNMQNWVVDEDIPMHGQPMHDPFGIHGGQEENGMHIPMHVQDMLWNMQDMHTPFGIHGGQEEDGMHIPMHVQDMRTPFGMHGGQEANAAQAAAVDQGFIRSTSNGVQHIPDQFGGGMGGPTT